MHLHIRPGSTRVDVYNSARLVYLYDEAAVDRLRPVLTEVSRNLQDPRSHPGLQDLGASGAIVIYEIAQDDELNLEVVVGPPLITKELKGAYWLAPQQAVLRLPSGRLFIDSADTLRAGVPGEATDPGATMEVPPGDYLLTLHRVHGDQMEAVGREDWRGPEEVVVLTPAADVSDLRLPSFLPFIPEDVSFPWWQKYTVSDRQVSGTLLSGGIDDLLTNIDRPALNAIGARPGTLLEVRVGKHDPTIVVFLPDLDRDRILEQLDRRTTPQISAAAWWWSHWDAHVDLLVVGQSDSHPRKVRSGSRVSVKALDTVDEIEDLELTVGASGQWHRPRALGDGEPVWETTVEEAALARIGASPGDDLLLTLKDEPGERPLHLFAKVESLLSAIATASALPEDEVRRLDELVDEYLRPERPDDDESSFYRQRRALKRLIALRYPQGFESVPWGAVVQPSSRRASGNVLLVAPLVTLPHARLDRPLYWPFSDRLTVRKPK